MDKTSFWKTCGAEEETTFHALFECTWARRFWQEIKQAIGTKILDLHPLTASDLVEGRLIPDDAACMILCG
jgi:hypothetical protein